MADKSISKIRAVAFDFDNTLVNTEKAMADAYAKIVAKIHIKYNVKEEALTEELARIQREFLNKKEKSKEDYDRRYWFQKLSNDLKIGISKEDIEEYRRIFYSHLRDEITFSEHTGDVLKNIKDSGKKLAILTEADPALPGFKQERLNKFPFYPLFDLSIIAGETIPEHKTQPEAFVKVTELLHMNPENVAFVGDSPEIDVKNAKEAGMIVILLLSYSENENPQFEPDYTAHSITGILDILE